MHPLAAGALSLPLAIMAVHRIAVWAAARRWPIRSIEPPGNMPLPPVTWLRPLKPGVRDLRTKLTTFLNALAPEDEAIFGVDPGSPEEALCSELAGAFPAAVRVVAVRVPPGANPKISRLEQMAPLAHHETWILADAEARIDAPFADAFRRDWAGCDADVLTAGYRFPHARSLPEWLDALAVIQTLWPGLLLARQAGPLRFTLGACTGLQRRDVAAIGGWSALGDRLAEDYELGVRLANEGRIVRLSAAVLDLESDPLTWAEYWRHQLRVAVTYRVATPWGAAGMIFTRGFTLSFALALLFPGALTALNALLAALLHLSAVAFQARRLGHAPGSWLAVSLLADVIETICWGLNWGIRQVWWAGQWRRITWRGQFTASPASSSR